MTWSQYFGLQSASGAARAAYQEEKAQQHEKMQAGPYLDGDTLIIPSEWYHAEAAGFWRSQGFHWNAGSNTWERDTARPSNGKRYSPAAWLEAARRKFYEFWPTLLKRCWYCQQKFIPDHPRQHACGQCEKYYVTKGDQTDESK